jgi:lysophospholipase L1-like esterase
MKFKWIILLLILTASCSTQITLYTIGDSTMANKPEPGKNPERGWGQMLQPYFTDAVIVDNRAVNGRSTRSFIVEKRWDSIYNVLKKGDYVFIQFGHNDEKEADPKRYTSPHSSYRNNLIRFVEDSRKKGAHPVLLTSIVRRNFNESGTLIDTHGDYPLETRLVAKELNVPLIDLQYFTELMEESYGVEGSKQLHLHFKPGENPYYPDGKEDNTHLSVKGATTVAEIVIRCLNESKIPLRKKIKK